MNSKNIFWQALFSAILIFGVGILLGVYFENIRNDTVQDILVESEIDLLDSQIMGEIPGGLDIGCDFYSEQIVEFADRIYQEAKTMEEYDSSNQVTQTLKAFHKRYDLLRVVLWQESSKFKEECGEDFHTIVYLYDYDNPSLDQETKQLVFSRVLEGYKAEFGSKVILIPIAADLDLKSIDLIKDSYKIQDLPVVIVDERIVLTDLDDLGTIREMVKR
jgi:hypothetical protein